MNNSNIPIVFILLTAFIVHIQSTRKLPKHSGPLEQQITLNTIQTPNIFEIELWCHRNTTVHFVVNQTLMLTYPEVQLMLRLDYLPNRCIKAKQDLPVLRKNHSEWSVTFEKSCCSLNAKSGVEKEKIVATARDAFMLFGFPISYKFWNYVIPVVIICVILAIIWSLDLHESHNHYIKNYGLVKSAAKHKKL